MMSGCAIFAVVLAFETAILGNRVTLRSIRARRNGTVAAWWDGLHRGRLMQCGGVG